MTRCPPQTKGAHPVVGWQIEGTAPHNRKKNVALNRNKRVATTTPCLVLMLFAKNLGVLDLLDSLQTFNSADIFSGSRKHRVACPQFFPITCENSSPHPPTCRLSMSLRCRQDTNTSADRNIGGHERKRERHARRNVSIRGQDWEAEVTPFPG